LSRLLRVTLFLFLPVHVGAQARVTGTVIDSGSRAPVGGAFVEATGTRFTARTADDGRFSLGRLPLGSYELRVMRLGFAPIRFMLSVSDSAARHLELSMTPTAIALASVVVTPGFYGVMQPGITPGHSLSREQIETAPQLGEDVYRSVARLPGVSVSDMSARFGVRGSTSDELYASLDGLELDEPFHLKDIDAALSILDVSTIAGVELSTGGFGAEYGNRLTGVFSMRSREPRTDRVRGAAALSILNARVAGEGGALDGRLGWLVSARRGYLDLALALSGYSDSLSPSYHDLFAKVHYDMPRFGRVSLRTLLANDRLNYYDGPRNHLLSRYGNSYVWGTWEGSLSDRLRQTTVLSLGHLLWNRGGDIRESDGLQTLFLDDERTSTVAAVRQDWQLDMGSSAMLKAGVHLKRVAARYDYHAWTLEREFQGGAVVEHWDTVRTMLAPDGYSVGAYVSQRLRIAPRLTVEVGLRYDDADYADDADLSPRLNAAWTIGPRTTVRGAWGRYAQSPAIHALSPGDGLASFWPSERAIHRGVGIEQQLSTSIVARAEVYERSVGRPRPRFVNLTNQLQVFSELETDRIRVDATSSRARGVETFFQHSGAGRTSWSASYSLAKITDRVGSVDVPRLSDNRHTVLADWAVHPVSNTWRFSAAALWHSGGPATARSFRVDSTGTGASKRFFVTPEFGGMNAERLPAYQRVDVRFTRYFDTRRGRVSLYADVFNLLGTENPRAYDYSIFVNPFFVRRGYDTYLPRLPSLGVSWEF
jgi:hypothetical protein